MGLSILLADDHGLYRESIKYWLESSDVNFHIETAANYDEVTAFLKSGKAPRLLLLDLCMPGMNGVDSVRKIHDGWPSTPILVVSANDDPLVIKGCIEAGAAGFIAKSKNGESILAAIRQILAGNSVIPRSAMISHMPTFSQKQLKILYLLADGCSNRDIAGKCHLTEGTVKQYVSDILSKLNVDNRVQAAIRSQKILGLISN